jgi:hypothetical protein
MEWRRTSLQCQELPGRRFVLLRCLAQRLKSRETAADQRHVGRRFWPFGERRPMEGNAKGLETPVEPAEGAASRETSEGKRGPKERSPFMSNTMSNKIGL